MTRLHVLLLLLLFLLPSGASAGDEAVMLTGDVQMQFGDAFLAEGEYYRAVTEYKKYLILFPDGRQADAALFKAGMASYRGMEYEAAAETFASVRARFPASSHAAESAYYEGVCYARLNRFDKSAPAFETAATYKPVSGFAPRARLGRALVEFDRGDPTGTRQGLNRFLTDFPGDPRTGNVRAALSLLPQEDELPRKSPVIAGILSALVPGSGHMYAGHYGDGATAFLLNGLFIAGTVVAIQQENYAVAGVVGVIGLPFYIGNIYGASNAATKWNLGVRKGLRDRLTVTLDYSF
jgi:outer membrane protein assembly factor BamD (BamD/ComL family)/TM2 domain-containing membrane protein YozV